MTFDQRQDEIRALCGLLDDGYVGTRRSLDDTASEVNRLLTRYIATITNQELITSSAVRRFTLARVVFPFALGACDAVSVRTGYNHHSAARTDQRGWSDSRRKWPGANQLLGVGCSLSCTNIYNAGRTKRERQHGKDQSICIKSIIIRG